MCYDVSMNNYKKLAFILMLSAVPAFAQGDKPLSGLNIMLDPGHGGADPGAVGKLGLKESDTNLRVSRYLKMLLEHDGAKVKLTREKPETSLSLSKRVAMSNEEMPDLFISIHHNASLNPKPQNRSEIYYNAMDRGVSRQVGLFINDSLAKEEFAGDSVMIPAGFYVLRNNKAPSILTEGSYISIPDSEKNLRSGKGLTNEATIIWKSLRKAFAKGTMKINLLTNDKNDLLLESPYFNILMTANKPISSVNARLDSTELGNIGLKNIMAYPMTYSLYNTKPLTSGKYELTLAAMSNDGIPSAQKKLNLNVVLPVEKAIIEPVAPYIPMGFKGRFPITIKLYDGQNKLNTRSALVRINYGENKSVENLTSSTGITTEYIELDGTETNSLNLSLSVEEKSMVSLNVPIAMPIQRFVLGKLNGINGTGIADAEISHNGKVITTTGNDGYFYIDYPLSNNEFSIDITPKTGHKAITETIKTNGEPVILPQFNAEALSPALFGKNIGIMAQPQLEEMTRNIVKPMVFAGANVKRLNLPEAMAHPEYQAALEANLTKNLDLIMSLKTENVKGIELRYYHSSKNGKKICDSIKNSFKESYPDVTIRSCAGSDYELGHTGATSIVISIPNKPDEKTREALMNQISKALKSGN